MEAFTDFTPTATTPTPPSSKTSITTYLEGELIDFQTHTLQTFSYPATPHSDASNWRKLYPFAALPDDALARALRSKRYLSAVADKWVLMRWKEVCFVTPRPSGLTIGGFYYLALRREDGKVQGFYYDPLSQPYQELVLKPQKRMFPTWEFR